MTQQEDINLASRTLLDFQLSLRWSIRDEFKHMYNVPHILDVVDTIFTLVGNESLSIARLADGELGLMTGAALPTARYQGYSNSLKRALYNVLLCNKKRCCVALPKWFIYKSEPVQAYNADKFSHNWASHVSIGRYFDFFKPDYQYLDACMSVPRAHYGSFGEPFLDAYYTIAKKLIYNKDIILVTGDTRYKTVEHKLIIDSSRTLDIVVTPQKEAWRAYADTKTNILKANPNGEKTVILCCGPMASVLAYELSDNMRCLDLGHMLVDYNMYRKGYGTGNFWH